jgi:drug/metabolite transporter (DMT)-like permease
VALPAPALVLGAIVSVQFGAAVAAGLIRELGPVLTATIRLDVAAVILMAFARPSLRGRTRRDWVAMALLGLSLAAMNLTFYQAIARLPLGVVTTIEFLGPLGLAAAAATPAAGHPGCGRRAGRRRGSLGRAHGLLGRARPTRVRVLDRGRCLLGCIHPMQPRGRPALAPPRLGSS